MPINAFGGGPGSGKTYGVIEHVILPAISKGRFVITNIEGLDDEAIYRYVVDNAPKGKIICIGHIRRCSRNAPEDEDFFPGEEALDKAVPVPSPDAPKVVGGDLVVVDEATRYWGQGDKIKRGHAYFFREHRHFANEIGHTCDLVVIDPDLTMLARALKGKIEMASVTHKPKEIGLNRYVVRLYRGVKLTGKPVSTQGPFAFKSEIYSLYKSYAHAGAKEQAIDKRQNILFSPRTLFLASCVGLLFIGSVGGGLYLWNREKSKYQAQSAKASASTSVPASRGGAAPAGPVPRAGSGSSSDSSNVLRVAGMVVLNGQSWVVVHDVSDGSVRFENPAVFVGRGVMMVGTIEGRRVASWTGAPRGGSQGGAVLPIGGQK